MKLFNDAAPHGPAELVQIEQPERALEETNA